MDPIESYFNKHSGRLFILGNGPSLSSHNLSKIIPNECITMNRSWDLVPRSLYHCLAGDLRIKMNPLPQHVLFLGQPSQYSSSFKMGCPVILIQTQILGAQIPKPKKDLGIPAEFDLRYGWPVTHCGLFAVYAAWFLGFREIYLLGFDASGYHYTDTIPPLPDHARLIKDFVKYTKRLLAYDPSLKLYNCNPENKYKNLPIKGI